MRNKVTSIGLLLAFLLMIGCATNIHVVGNGAQGNTVNQQRQWYVLWGLVKINDVNTNTMHNDTVNYTIKTQQSALDVVINIFTSAVTVGSRTVTVTY
jgi:hypothetical protein